MTETIAAVIRKHYRDGGYNYDLEQQICGCGESYAKGTHPEHVASIILAKL